MLWWKRISMLVGMNTKAGDYSNTHGWPDRSKNPDQPRLVRWSGYYDSDFLVRSVVRIFFKTVRLKYDDTHSDQKFSESSTPSLREIAYETPPYCVETLTKRPSTEGLDFIFGEFLVRMCVIIFETHWWTLEYPKSQSVQLSTKVRQIQ